MVQHTTQPPQQIQPHTLRSDQLDCRVADWTSKSKAPSQTQPVAISQLSIHHDFFDINSSPVASNSLSSFHDDSPTTSSFTASSPQSSNNSFGGAVLTTIDPVLVQDLHSTDEIQFSISSVSSKDKQKGISPALSPLSISDMDFGCEQASWSSFRSVSSPGPSSCASASSPVRDTVTAAGGALASTGAVSVSVDDVFSGSLTMRTPSRCHSASIMSLQHTPSLASLDMPKVKIRLRPPATEDKLPNGKRGDTTSDSSISSETTFLTAGTAPNLNSTMVPWYAAPLHHNLDTSVPPPFVWSCADTESKVRSRPSLLMLRTKGRSRSSPIPFSALDFVPATVTDIFKPLTLLRRRYFDQILPKELQLYILKCFAQSIEDDHIRSVAEGRWTISRAISLRHQLVGRDRGIRELLKLAGVSHSFKSLVYDGQLWADLDLHSFPGLPEPTLLRLMSSGGAFIRKINLAGHCCLPPSILTVLTDHLRAPLSYTNLTSINLQGCSALTTCSFHHLLVRCKSLQRLCLKGLAAVTNTTCELLATFCTRLEYLNLNRCPNMDAEGIRHLARTTLAQGEYLRLKELKISGLKHMDDATMRVLGKATPYLQVLDLSYIRHLHSSALESFVAINDESDYAQSDVEIVRLRAHQIGRDSSSDHSQFYRRRVTQLRHLSLSFCALLTDVACSNLAYTVPRLEFLEMAGIGEELKDDGLIRLLETTPRIRRLDLEDASDITDSVLSAITPVDEQPSWSPRQNGVSQPGHALEWLCVSHAGNVSDDTFLALIRACPKLRVLEADNTRLSGSTLREFVHLNRQHKAFNAKVVAIDCRSIVEGDVRELGSKGEIRTRVGIRTFWARRLGYVDGNDELYEEDLKVGLDECDSAKVAVKSFYSWQTVDAVNNAREKRRKVGSRRTASPSSDYPDELFDNCIGGGRGGRGAGLPRWWWSSNGRPGRNSSLVLPDIASDGCIIM